MKIEFELTEVQDKTLEELIAGKSITKEQAAKTVLINWMIQTKQQQVAKEIREA